MAGDGQARRHEGRMTTAHRMCDGGQCRSSGGLPLLALILAAMLAAAAAPAHAQSYPNRPIKLIVAVLPGGPMDVMGRLIAQHLSSTLGQVFVENRAGAGTTLGAKAVASAEPDGHTLAMGQLGNMAISPVMNTRQFGIGATVAVLLDATVVRLILLPALVKLAGDRTWWVPRILRRRRFGKPFSDEATVPGEHAPAT